MKIFEDIVDEKALCSTVVTSLELLESRNNNFLGERLGTVDLLIKVACFVTRVQCYKKNYGRNLRIFVMS